LELIALSPFGSGHSSVSRRLRASITAKGEEE
jgi:hypothetical protein